MNESNLRREAMRLQREREECAISKIVAQDRINAIDERMSEIMSELEKSKLSDAMRKLF